MSRNNLIIVFACKGGLLVSERLHHRPGRPRRDERTVKLPDLILSAAAHQFTNAGFEHTTMNMVAVACDITKATVYYYFPSKSALFVASVTHLIGIIRQQVLSLLSQTQSLRSRLAAIARIRLSIPNSLVNFEAMIRDAMPRLNAEDIRKIHEAVEQLTMVLTDSIAAAIQQGEVRPVDPVLTAHVFLAALEAGFAKNSQGQPKFPDSSTTADALVDVLMDGLLVSPGP